MRPLGSLTAAIVARHAAERKQLQEAHEQAAAFHEAIAEAMQADADLAEYMEVFGPGDFDTERARKRYPEALGRAAVALQKMPVKWAAILSVELDRIQSNVVALRPNAAE